MTDFVTIQLERTMKHNQKETPYKISFTVKCEAWPLISPEELKKVFEEDWNTFREEAQTHMVAQFERMK